MIDKLIIIGNGFDMHHKLPTSFKDFKKYIAKNNSELTYILDTYFDGDLWADFEHNLSNFNLQLVSTDNYDLLPNDSDRSGDMYIFEDAMDRIVKKLTVGLKNSLRDWILQLTPAANTATQLVSEIDNGYFYLTFNYSGTLEDYYNIEPKNILYIHNKAKNMKKKIKEMDFIDDSDIIIGHSLNKKKNDFKKNNDIRGLDKFAYDEGIEKLLEYLELSYKNTIKIIAQNSNFFKRSFSEIQVFGHSISDVDLLYFKKIHDQNLNAKWNISYHQHSDLPRLENQVREFKGDLKNVDFFQF